MTSDGHIAEGVAENLFIFKDGRPITSMTTNGILEGITRATLIEIFKEDHGLGVIERNIDRTELYTTDEAFFCGSGAEVTPIFSIDKYVIGSGEEGPLTHKIPSTFFDVVGGNFPKYNKWLTAVYRPQK